MILSRDNEFQEMVLGKAYAYSDESIERVFENTWEIEDAYSIEESRDAFMQIVDEYLVKK